MENKVEHRGYAKALFTSAPHSDLICELCDNVLEHPKQCNEGHCFCSSCFDAWTAEGNQGCPAGDDQPKSGPAMFSRNKALEAVIDRLDIKCSCVLECKPGDQQCDWTGPLKELDAHLESCQYVKVACPNSGCPAMTERYLQQHHSLICPHREVHCEHCDQSMQARQLAEHLAICPLCPVTCACGATFTRQEKQKHEEKCLDCDVVCSFKEFGCSALMPRRLQEQHEQDEARAHADLLRKALQEQQLTGLINVISKQVSGLTQDLKSMQSAVEKYEVSATAAKRKRSVAESTEGGARATQLEDQSQQETQSDAEKDLDEQEEPKHKRKHRKKRPRMAALVAKEKIKVQKDGKRVYVNYFVDRDSKARVKSWNVGKTRTKVEALTLAGAFLEELHAKRPQVRFTS